MADLCGKQLDVILEQIADKNQVVRLRESMLLAAQIADSLNQAHQQGIVHGHLTPATIRLEEVPQPHERAELPLRVRVTGLDGPGAPSNNQVSTLPYLSPEQCLQQETDNRCDIYALGAILYQLVTGRLPYTFTSMAEAARLHGADAVAPAPQAIRPGLPATVAAIIHKAMARSPEKRFVAAGQMAYALRQAAALLTEAAEKNFAPQDATATLLAEPVAATIGAAADGDGASLSTAETLQARQEPVPGPIQPDERAVVSDPAPDSVLVVTEPDTSGPRGHGQWIAKVRHLANHSRPHHLFVGGLLATWLLVVVGVPAYLPVQLASWLTFIALLITPGYMLADLITWRARLDELERLALALPLGVAILAMPGAVALLQHLTLTELVTGWAVVTALIAAVWLWHGWRLRRQARPAGNDDQTGHTPWAADEIAMLLLLLAAFIAVLPTLSLHKIDGDAYAVGAFAADALSGLPLNASEPLFGTDFGPGVRMVFNQSLPLSYLWSYLSKIDPITLTATASRSMLALWALLASYTLGKAAGNGSRRFGLFTASIQMLIYLAAPFARGDNVSLFFFERINADKFMVPVTMLPVVFALAIRFAGDPVANAASGRRDVWLAAAVATFAVSTIHPLVAAMLALAIGAFALLHWLVNWRQRQSLKRSLALGGLVAVAMFLPAVQLVAARGEAPLAPSYPDTFAGWPIGEKQTPVLPFVHARTLDLYGPLPQLSQLEADAANSVTNPFLIWRFAVNMDRQRLILLDLDQYISDPTLILEPPYLLALLLLPLLLRRLRRSVAAQFAVATTVAVLFVMFNPVVTPLIGSLVMPWILWRFVWLLPYALVIALAARQLLLRVSPALADGVHRLPLPFHSLKNHARPGISQWAAGAGTWYPLAFVFIAGLVLALPSLRNIQNLADRSAAPYFFPTPERLLIRLNELTARSGPVTVLADQDLSVTIPAYVARANVVAHRPPTTSELFPADRQDEALQRLIDQEAFFASPYLTSAAVDVLHRYDAGYVITASGSDLDMQLRLAPQWFEWLLDDQSYSLYAVRQLGNPSTTSGQALGSQTTVIRANDALAQQQWAVAERLYRAALAEDSGDLSLRQAQGRRFEDSGPGSGQALLALAGLAESAYAQGRFDEALARLQQAAAQADLPGLHYRLGRLYLERGQPELAVAELRQAQQAAPHVARYHVALGHACLAAGGPESEKDECAAEQYAAAVASENLPDAAARLIAQADLWRQQSRLDRALPLYEQAVALRPSQYNRLVLERVYREAGQFEPAQALLQALRSEYPFSAEMATAAAVAASQNRHEAAISLYRRAIWLQMLQAQETAATRLALARLLLESGRPDEASPEIERVLALQPYNADAHRLQAELYSRQMRFAEAAAATGRAVELDPAQVLFYAAAGDQLELSAGRPEVTLTRFQAAVHDRPGEAALLLALGDQWLNLGEPQAALAAYQAALSRLDPYLVPTRLRPLAPAQSRAFACARLARLYENLGQVEAAMNYYRATVVAAADEPWAHVAMGDALRRRNDLAGAETAYRRAISVGGAGNGAAHPDHVNATVRLAELLAAAGDQAQAGELYSKALALATRLAQPQRVEQPENASLLLSLSMPLFSDESLDAAASSAATAAATTSLPQLAPAGANSDSVAHAIRDLARLYLVQGQAGQAIALYRQRLEQGEVAGWPPTVLAQYHKSLGDLYLSQNQLDQATAAYRQAVSRASGWTEARLGLAEAMAAQGDTVAALAQLQTAVTAAPGSAEAQIALANLLDQQGESDRALAIYRETATLYPGQPRATLALARAWQDRHQWQHAEQLFQQTIALNAGTADAYAGLAELYINQRRYDEAEILLQQALAVDKQNANVYLRLGDLSQSRGDAEQALAWYQQAAAQPPLGQSSSGTLVDSLIRHGDTDTALATIESALERQPDDGLLWLRRGEIQRALGHYEAAEAALRRAKSLAPADARIDVALGRLHVAQGDLQAALVAYQQAITRRPAEALHYLLAGEVLVALADFDGALAVLQDGQSHAGQPAPVRAAIASLYLQQAKPDLARQTLEEGLTADSENIRLRLALGRYYASRADFHQAEQQYNHVLAQQPDSATAHAALGDLYLRRGDGAAALHYYEQAIALEPVNPGYYLALGNSYQLGQRTEEATNAYFQALLVAPNLANAYAALAVHYQGQERWDEARIMYERGLAIAPTSEILLAGYSTYLLGRGEAETALALLDEAVQRSPTAATLTARASLYRALGLNQEAEQDLQAARFQTPGSVTVLVALGDFYRAQGDPERARQSYENAVSLLPGIPTGYLRLGDLASEQGDLEQAQQYAEAARAAEPGALVRPESGP